MATVPTPTTVTVGQRLTAALWNEDVDDAVNFLIAEPQCQAYASATTTLTTATWGVVALAAEDADNDVMHDVTTNNSRVVAKTAGTYMVIAQVQHTAVNTTGSRQGQIRKNAAGAVGSGTSVVVMTRDANPSASVSSILIGSRLITLAADDYLEMFAYQSSGGNNTSASGADATFLHMAWVGV